MTTLLTKLKQRVQVWMTAEAKTAHKIGLTPNIVSALGIGFAVLSAFAYWKWDTHPLLAALAPLLLLASGFCDALDGVMARLHGEETPFGGFLDSLLDRYADATILCGIILGGLCDPLWGLAALMGSLLVSYTRARAEAAGIQMETVGFAERAERVVILMAASLLSLAWRPVLNGGIIVLAVLTHLTVLQRAAHFFKVSQRNAHARA